MRESLLLVFHDTKQLHHILVKDTKIFSKMSIGNFKTKMKTV